MSSKHTKYLFCLYLFLTVAACIPSSLETTENGVRLQEVFTTTPAERLSERQLQAEVMAFADQFTMVYWQAMDQLQYAELPAEKKLAAEYAKLIYISSALSIAAQPSPAASLLDMLTFVRLGHQAVESYWVPEVYGPAGEPLLTAYRQLEKDAWQMASRVLTEAQRETVRELIDQWRREHPNQWYVSDVRLQAFSAARGRPVHPVSREASGLLSSIGETLYEVDETLLVAERALFLGERMPRLITLQTELLIEQVTDNPMFAKLTADFSEFQKTGARMAAAIESLPDNVAAERKQVLNRLDTILQDQREAWMQDLSAQGGAWGSLLDNLQGTLAAGSQTAQDYRALVEALQKLTQREEGKSPEATLDKSILLAEKAGQMAQELSLLVNQVDRLMADGSFKELSPQVRELLEQVKQEEAKLIDRAFLLGAVLILLGLAGSLGVALCYRMLSERYFPRKERRG